MKRLLQVCVLVGVMLIMSTSAWSFDKTNHVSQAPNGKGDVLIYPMYMVLDGSFQTHIQVVNTKNDASAVAKVIVRSPVNSFELRDFLIFLTPNDMWEGTLKMKDGEVVIYSEDDSTVTSTVPTFATPADPFEFALETKSCDTNIYGYVEVFLGHVFNRDDGDVNLTRSPVKKTDLYDAYVGSGSFSDPVPSTGDFPESFSPEYTNILAGNMQIETSTSFWTSALNAVALKNYNRNDVMTVQFETFFGERAINTIDEVEAALAKNQIGMPYYNNQNDGKFTLHMFNFPTKHVRDLDGQCNPTEWRGKYAGFPKVPVDFKAFDMEENTVATKKPIVSPYPEEEKTTFDEELSLLVPQAFIQGWQRYSFPAGPTMGKTANDNDLSYEGAPVIPFAIHFGERGLSMQNGFWTNTDVEVDGELIGDYQFVQGFVTTTE